MVLLNIESKSELASIIEEALKKTLQDVVKEKDNPDRLMDRQQAADYLHISLGTLHGHTKTGRLCGQRIGARLLYRKSDLDKFLKPTK